MMKLTPEKKIKLLFALSGFFAAMAGLFMWKYARDLHTSLGGLTPIAVAAVDIAPREVITPDKVRFVSIPKRYATPYHVSSSEEVIGNVSLIPVKKGEWFTKSSLRPATFLSQENLRLIPLDDESGTGRGCRTYVDPYLQPGDRADLVVTVVKDEGPEKVALTQVFRTDLEVAEVLEGEAQGKKIRRVYLAVPFEEVPALLHVFHHAEHVDLLKAGTAAKKTEKPLPEPISSKYRGKK